MEEYLNEFLQDSPSSRLKLLAAWDGLTVETQIQILWTLGHSGAGFHLDICDQALKSKNEYVRYLAAKYGRYSGEGGEKLRGRIRKDPSGLVKFAGEEDGFSFSDEEFGKFPYQKQLARSRGTSPIWIPQFAAWLGAASADPKQDKNDFYNVVCEYVRNPRFRNADPMPFDGYEWYENKRGFESIWQFVPQLSRDIAYEIFNHAPVDGYGISKEALEWAMREAPILIDGMLNRDDVKMYELRKTIFMSPSGEGASHQWKDYHLRQAAASHNLYLHDDQYHEIFTKRPELLGFLVYGRSIPLVVQAAAKDCLKTQDSKLGDTYLDQHILGKNFDRRLAGLKSNDPKFETLDREAEYRELGLYDLATSVMPWREKKPKRDRLFEPIRWLEDFAVAGDTWGTYLQFKRRFPEKGGEHWLPPAETLSEEEQAKVDELKDRDWAAWEQKKKRLAQQARKDVRVQEPGFIARMFRSLAGHA